ncbi:MAG TPA: class I SAM-dependent methyltransferase [Geobacteraceae bacterium]|nr:class I SAM-dependent methyltransferase [Geobacteraceae bacterium]
MTGIELYRDAGLQIYEKAHYSRGEHIREVEAILSWHRRDGSRILDMGCGGGLHAIELAKRGYLVTGIDVETSAIALARQRSRESNLDAVFFVADLENCEPAAFGRFNLVCGLGNVISHIPKKTLPKVLGKVRSCMEDDGVFLFDALLAGDPFPEEVREKELGIIWKRTLDRATGEIRMTGIFEDFGITQDFLVWGYTREEMLAILMGSGFSKIDVSDSLDFPGRDVHSANPVCLKYRAWMGRRHEKI